MKKLSLILTLIISIVLSTENRLSSAMAQWQSAQATFIGALDTNKMIDDLLYYLNSENPKPGDQIIKTKNGVLRKIKLSKITGGSYQYLLEVWPMHDSGDSLGPRYQKGLEMKFNNGYKGEIIVKPAMFNESNLAANPAYVPLEEGHWCKAVYNHANDTDKNMVIHFIHAVNNKAEKGIYNIKSNGNHTTLYMTAILPANHISAPNYVYTLAMAFDKKTSSNTIAQYGVLDPDDTIGLTWPNGVANPYNTGKFNTDGFVADGYTGGDTNFPDLSLIDAALLPPKNEVQNLTIHFNESLEPGF